MSARARIILIIVSKTEILLNHTKLIILLYMRKRARERGQDERRKLIAGITATHWNAHTAFGKWWICWNRNTCRMMPSTWSWENRAIGGSTFAEWTVCHIIFVAIGVLGIVTIIWTTFAPVADEERSTLFNAATMLAYGRTWTGDVLTAILSIAQRVS